MKTSNYFRWSDVIILGFIGGVIIMTILWAWIDVYDYRASIVCAREGYPTVKRTGPTTVVCFKVENGNTISKEY